MKKKILGLSAILMAFAMTTSAFAAVQRGDSATLDGRTGLSGQDLAMILDYAKTAYNGENADAANFDGNWAATDNKVTNSDYAAALKYMLQPTDFEETLAIRVYSSTNTVVGTKVANPASGLVTTESEKWDGTINSEASLTTDSDKSVEEIADALVAQATQSSADSLTTNLRNVCFTSAAKGDVYLTTDEGWAVLAYSLRAIIPVDEANCIIFNKDYASLPTEEKAENMSAEVQAQYDAFNKLKAYVMKAKDKDLTVADYQAMYELGKVAFPETITEDALAKTADRVNEVVKGKYKVSVNGMDVSDSNSEGFKKLVGLSNYKTTTVQTIRDTLGDTIEVAVTGPSGNVFKFNADLYVQGGQKAVG